MNEYVVTPSTSALYALNDWKLISSIRSSVNRQAEREVNSVNPWVFNNEKTSFLIAELTFLESMDKRLTVRGSPARAPSK